MGAVLTTGVSPLSNVIMLASAYLQSLLGVAHAATSKHIYSTSYKGQVAKAAVTFFMHASFLVIPVVCISRAKENQINLALYFPPLIYFALQSISSALELGNILLE